MDIDKLNINKDIKAKIVLLIDETGTNKGKVELNQALFMASKLNLDLVEVSSDSIPVCRIMDYGKHKYEQTKKVKKSKNQSPKVENKEIRFRPNTGENDLIYRAKQVDQFLKNGYKIKLVVQFKGRELEHMSKTGKNLLEKFFVLISSKFKVNNNPEIEGRSITVWINNG